MKNLLTFSIIIPAYNEKHHLAACLDAIEKQTVKPNEVIVVDNNSTDTTSEIAQSYKFVKVIHEKQQGIVYARDAGFRAAKSDLLGRIDADTILPKDWVKERLEFYSDPKHTNVAWTGGGRYYNVRLPKFFMVMHRLLVFELNKFVMGGEILWGSNMVIPKQIWLKVSSSTCKRTDIHEDIDLAIHLHQRGFKVVHEPGKLVGVKLRRVRSHRQDLWANLQWWPRTLKVHGYKLWVVSWFFGDLLVYLFSGAPELFERIAGSFGKKPIRD